MKYGKYFKYSYKKTPVFTDQAFLFSYYIVLVDLTCSGDVHTTVDVGDFTSDTRS